MKIFRNLKKRDIIFILICLVLVFCQVWLELKMPDYTQKLTQAVSAGSMEKSDIWHNGGMMILCAFGSMAASIVCGFFAAQVAANFSKTLREKLFDRVTDFGNAEMNRFSTPSLITRTTNDVVQMQNLIAMGLQVLIKAPVMAIWAICKISTTSIEWTMATMVTVAIMLLAITFLIIAVLPKFKVVQKLTDALNNVTRENISGVRVIRAFNAEKYQMNKFDAVNKEITGKQLFTSRSTSVMMPLMTACSSGLTVAIYWIGAYLINEADLIDRAVVFGNMAAFTQYALQIVAAFMMIAGIFVIFPRTMVSAKRIQEVLDTKSSITYPTKGHSAASGRIEFKNVSFAYADDGNPCIEDLSFTVEPGQTFAIIGATGSGKTSLVNLIPRFYDATEGQILIDGIDVKEYTREQVEHLVSVAPQKAILFSGDIKSNITYGCDFPVADDDARLEQALEVSCSDFVNDLEKGIHAEVAQGGTNYSGGQKQRLSIARAVFKDSKIKIFDDTFSALDYKTDMRVRKQLHEQLAGTTVILVAQRIGTIRNADQILVLDNGKIAGLGTHDQLLETCPVYREIALSQLSEEEL